MSGHLDPLDPDFKTEALEQFLRRKRYAKQIQKYDDYGTHAGTPHNYYCEHCGTPIEVLPEDNLFAHGVQCSQCAALLRNGWLVEAKELAVKMGME